ncbi:hypothetical protein F5884DRAFT_687198 [Xylogone sp. PMI_703]|nr:hypothetical protein F5884DRAFT_687198 [Xylogone sp. PMI_703]
MPVTIPTVLLYTFAALAFPLLGSPAARASKLPLPARMVHQFPNPTWIENIAVRANGDLLLTTVAPNASLYVLENPQAQASQPSVKLLNTFGVDSLTGIAETHPDKFVVVGGNFSGNAVGVQGSFAAWTVDFGFNDVAPQIKTVAHLSKAVFLNGVTTVPGCNEVLIADSTLGLAWHLNVETGDYEVGIRRPEMAPTQDAPLKIGVNGIHYFNGYVYWTNSFEATLYRIEVGRQGHPAPGAVVETVAKVNASFLDDFTIDTNATTWATTHLDNRLVTIKPNGVSVVVEGSLHELTVTGDTACQFGRTEEDKDTLYVVTDGGLAAYALHVNGTIVEGGKVVAIDTRGF